MKYIAGLAFLWLALAPSWGLAQTCSGSNNNNLFALSGTNNATLSSINPLGAGTYTIALNTTVTNATNSGTCFAVTVTGSGGGGGGGGTGCQDADGAAGRVPSGWTCDSAYSADFDRGPYGGPEALDTTKFNWFVNVGLNTGPPNCPYNQYVVSDSAHNYIDSQGFHNAFSTDGTSIFLGRSWISMVQPYNVNGTGFLPANYYYEYKFLLPSKVGYASWSEGYGVAYGGYSITKTELDDNEGGALNWFLRGGTTDYSNVIDSAIGLVNPVPFTGFSWHTIGRLRVNGAYNWWYDGTLLNVAGLNPMRASAMPRVGGASSNIPPFADSRDWLFFVAGVNNCIPNLDKVPDQFIIVYYHVYHA